MCKKYNDSDLVEVPCPLCGANSSHFFGSERTLNTVTCTECALLYVTPRLSTTKLTEIYSKYYHRQNHWQEYIKDNNLSNTGIKKADKSLDLWNTRYQEIWNNLKPRLDCSRPLRHIDIGAGSSSWSNWLKANAKAEIEFWTFDISENYKTSQENNTKSIVAPNLKEAKIPRNYFDLITLFDVIEHYENPNDELNEITKLLSKEGCLFIQTPNAWWIKIKYKISKVIPKAITKNLVADYGILLPEQHLQYYNLTTIKKQVNQCNLKYITNFEVNWKEPSTGILSKILYFIVNLQCKFINKITKSKISTNIGISIIAKK